MNIDKRAKELGLTLPPPMSTQGLPFSTVVIDGSTAYISGHLPLNDEGKIFGPLGPVGETGDSIVTPEQAYESARRVCIGILASLQARLGSLERVDRWLKLLGFVNVAPGFKAIPPVVNGASDLILELYGSLRGEHTRSAIGVAQLPFGAPVEIEAVVKVKP